MCNEYPDRRSRPHTGTPMPRVMTGGFRFPRLAWFVLVTLWTSAAALGIFVAARLIGVDERIAGMLAMLAAGLLAGGWLVRALLAEAVAAMEREDPHHKDKPPQ